MLAVVLVWLLVWRGDAPPPPSVLERSAALATTTTGAATDPPAGADPQPADPPAPVPPAATPPATDPQPADPPAPVPPAATPPAAEVPAPLEEGPAPAVNLDGVWTVNTTLGSYEDYTGSWAGYRVGEELAGVGTTDAVGRTPDVSGTLELAGSTVVAATLEVDLTTVVSDRPQRDGLVRRALNTAEFPLARFELTEPVAFDALPPAGEQVSATVAGVFEVHGTRRPVTISLDATWVDEVLIVGGAFEIRFEDYGIVPPRAPVVLSVSDTGTVELLLNFTR